MVKFDKNMFLINKPTKNRGIVNKNINIIKKRIKYTYKDTNTSSFKKQEKILFLHSNKFL